MNTLMWLHPLTARHVDFLVSVLGYHVLGPIEKRLACGDVGQGAMLEWKEIVQVVVKRFGLERLVPSASVAPAVHPHPQRRPSAARDASLSARTFSAPSAARRPAPTPARDMRDPDAPGRRDEPGAADGPAQRTAEEGRAAGPPPPLPSRPAWLGEEADGEHARPD